ncbi:MYND-type domain-containing protein [Mycena venus]|uniref:MYND-type domain-containing protein n=1 Tax=Mycena venus TaxID=2733690 RepID=A0A8H6X7V7_9AGAR|nr:MYND-type domain-containing protein [Mycena venus]
MPSNAKSATKQERTRLAFSLTNPMHADAYCILGIQQVLDKVVFRKDAEHDPRQGPVLRAAMTFMSTRRTSQELALLRTRLTTCGCKPSIRAQHIFVSRPLEEVLELALFDICGTISDYFLRIGAGKFLKVKANTPVDERPWPSSITDVIPAAGGEREVLSGLVQWAAIVPGGHSVFCLIGALARYWEPFAQEVFRTPDLTRGTGTTRGPRRRNNTTSSSPPVIACAQGFFHTLSEVDFRMTIALLPTIYERMYDIAVSIEPILKDHFRMSLQLNMDDCRRWFDLVCRIRPAISPDGQWIKPENPPEIKDPRSHFALAYHRMAETRNRNQCLHIECTTKIVQRSSLCSRCGIVRYCSKECLAAAWDSPQHAHKTLCKRIARLRAATLLKDDKAWTHTMRDSSVHRDPETFAIMCARLGADADDAAGIYREIMRVTEAKVKFAENGAKTEAAVDQASDLPIENLELD